MTVRFVPISILTVIYLLRHKGKHIYLIGELSMYCENFPPLGDIMGIVTTQIKQNVFHTFL